MGRRDSVERAARLRIVTDLNNLRRSLAARSGPLRSRGSRNTQYRWNSSRESASDLPLPLARRVRCMLPWLSTLADAPGGTTMVDDVSSINEGPSIGRISDGLPGSSRDVESDRRIRRLT